MEEVYTGGDTGKAIKELEKTLRDSNSIATKQNRIMIGLTIAISLLTLAQVIFLVLSLFCPELIQHK